MYVIAFCSDRMDAMNDGMYMNGNGSGVSTNIQILAYFVLFCIRKCLCGVKVRVGGEFLAEREKPGGTG